MPELRKLTPEEAEKGRRIQDLAGRLIRWLAEQGGDTPEREAEVFSAVAMVLCLGAYMRCDQDPERAERLLHDMVHYWLAVGTEKGERFDA